MKITYYGHSCFLLETMGKKIILDPFISHNDKASHIDVLNITADYILLTHGHQDHVADVDIIAKNNDCIIVSNFETASYYNEKGFNHQPMNHGGKWSFDFGTVKYVSAIHSSVLPDGTYAGNPGGFVIWNDEGCVYFAGDTALTMDMKLIPITCPDLDLAVLPIGDCFTMGYDDAVIASTFVKCDRVLGCHYDTFGFIEINQQAAEQAFNKAGKNLLLPKIGETVKV